MAARPKGSSTLTCANCAHTWALRWPTHMTKTKVPFVMAESGRIQACPECGRADSLKIVAMRVERAVG